MHKKILMLLTGGTIGSSSKNGVISTDTDGCTAVEKYFGHYGRDTDFTVVRLMNILSENLNKTHWEIIVNYLISASLDDFDSVILTHGSDTLSYSSAMLAMCLGGRLNRPLFITAANYVPYDPKSNAVQNIRAAVVLTDIIKKGIFTVYKNPQDSACSIFIPTRLREADRFADRFSSADGSPLGYVENDIFKPYNSSVSLDDIQTKRKSLWNKYYELLKPIADKGCFRLPDIPDYATNNAHMFYLVCNSLEERTALINKLKENDILAVFHYLSLHSSPYYQDKHDGRDLPNCDRYADCLVRLPMYYDLTEADVERICEVIKGQF